MHEDTENGLHQGTEKLLLYLRPPDWKARRRPGTISAVSEKEPIRKLTMDVRKLTMDQAPPGDLLTGYEEVVQEARRRVWEADAARYYAHRRHAQSGSETDRLLWLARCRESDRALAELDEAERALAQARVARRGGGHGP